MKQLKDRISAFVSLGEYLRIGFESDNEMSEAIEKSIAQNHWFTNDSIAFSFRSIGSILTEEAINDWIKPYRNKFSNLQELKTVAVIMAGNIPIVGFHDFLSVLISGHRLLARLSSDDKYLLPFLAKRLVEFCSDFDEKIILTEETIKKPDAVIATGSNNTARYFDYYFGKYPNIIRQNRNGVAVLSGDESDDDLKSLALDIFQYFGLGCRNVSKIYVPENYNFDRLFHSFESYRSVSMHNKYNNNYEYYRSIYLINSVKHLDNGFVMLKPDPAISSPLAVVNYEEYKNRETVNSILEARKDEIQCIVSSINFGGAIDFGQSQFPQLNDFADGINSLDFLANLK